MDATQRSRKTGRRLARGVVLLALAVLVAVPVAGADWWKDGDDRVFYLVGTARVDRDPENPENFVVRLRSAFDPADPAAAESGAIVRVFDRRVEVWDLDNQLEAKAWFREPHSCGIGSPRMSLAIDRDGDGDSDGNAFGYVGTSPGFVACPMRTWLYEDFTGGDSITGAGPLPSANPPGVPGEPGGPPNEELEWDLTQFGGPFYNSWSQVEVFFAAQPEHRVCAARYVEDFGAPPGTSYADLVTMGNAVLEGPEDVAGRGDPFRGDPCRFGRDDEDDHDDDDDEDEDEDDDDG
jgi:hypothetical protein